MFRYLGENPNSAENEYICNVLRSWYRPVWMMRFVGSGFVILGLIVLRMLAAVVSQAVSASGKGIFLGVLLSFALLGMILIFFFAAHCFIIAEPAKRKKMLDSIHSGNVRISHITITDYYTTSGGKNAGGSTYVRSFIAEDGRSYNKTYKLKGRWGRGPYKQGIIYEVLEGEKVLDSGVMPVM